MIRISQIIGLSRLSARRCPKSIQRVFVGIRSSMKKYERSIQPIKISLLLSTSQFTVVNLEDEDEENQEENESTTLNAVQELCNNFLSLTMDFLNIIFVAISDSALEYKTALNELCSCLEKYETSKEFTHTLEELEDAIISARAKVFDCEQKYLGMITVLHSVEKLASAIGELSFILGAEKPTLVLNSILHSVSENIKLDSIEIKRIKKKLHKYESAPFSSLEIRNYENNSSSTDDSRNNDSNDNNIRNTGVNG